MSMFPPPPPGQGPVDPRGAMSGPPPGQPPPHMMPPPMGYPPMMMLPPPAPRGGGWARGIFLTLATTIFGLSLTLNIYLLIVTGLMGGAASTSLHTTVEQDGDARQQIAVVPVRGIIVDQTYQQFDRWIDAIEANANVKAVVIEVETPGGGVTPSDQIHRRIAQLKQKRNIPVVVAMGGFATSGGYYVSANADHIIAQPTTWTGNIGVLLQRLNIAKLGEKVGIEDATLTPEGSDFKDAGSPWRVETAEERAYWTGLIEDAYGTFKQVVEEGRKGKLKASIDVIANGEAFTAKRALELGLIDQVGYSDDAFAKAAQLAGLSRPRVVRYSRPPSIFDAFSSESRLKLNLEDGLRFDRALLDELLQPRVLYR